MTPQDELEQGIAAWRAEARARDLSPRQLDELEEHLRDAVDELLRTGKAARLTPSDALAVAQRRLGDVGALEHEFERVDGGAPWRRRAQWMLLGMLLLLAIRSLAKAAGWGAAALGASLGLTGRSLASLFVAADLVVLTAALLLAVSVVCGRGRTTRALDGILAWTDRRLSPRRPLVAAGLLATVTCSLDDVAALLFVPVLTRHLDSSAYGLLATSNRTFTVLETLFLPLALVLLLGVLHRRERGPVTPAAD